MTIREVVDVAHLGDSADVLDDHDELQRRWDADGYLFLRGVIDTDALEKVRRAYMKRLVEQGMVESIDGASVWTGVQPKGSRAIPYEDLGEPVWKQLVNHSSFDRMIRAVLGEAPSWVPIVSYRAALPTPAAEVPDDLFFGRHQDGYFNRGIDFRICWVPLMEIPPSVGGLAIAPGHHRKGFLHDEQSKKILPQVVADESWRRADYVPGDVLIFHNLTPHAPLVNGSDLIRLSIDVRVLPKSAVQPVVGTIISVDESSLMIRGDDGANVSLCVDENTYFRGIGPAVERLSAGQRVIASTDDGGKRAVVVRLAT